MGGSEEKASRFSARPLSKSRDIRVRSAARNRAEDRKQNHGADEGDHDLHEDVGYCDAKQAREPTAYESAKDSDHYVPDQPHAMAAEHLAGQESRDQADDQPNDDAS